MAKTSVSTTARIREAKSKTRNIVLTADSLREIIHYDPETGEFRWIKPGQGREVGVGWIGASNKGNRYKRKMICINYKSYMAHRLAWLYVTGEWPKMDIDHINRNALDNRWVNLREATRKENSNNCSLRSDNKSGMAGVYWVKTMKKWRVEIYFDDKEEAKRFALLHRKGSEGK